ncbi:hypothetical protein BLOT_006496 [Blomia tropicalis]|nr:hypothetical protein BLOT_006496 [Blomia tropicalis]
MSPPTVICVYNNFNCSKWKIKPLKLLILTTYILLLTNLLVTVNCLRCINDGCDCKFISGKKFASCIGLNLNKLPNCFQLDPSDTNSLQDIQVVNLTQNYFPELTSEFFHRACLDNLQKVYLQQVGLKIIDNNAFYPLKNIIELSFTLNSLRTIPTKAIENLTYLRHLDLSFNNIDYIANDSFVTLTNLQTLSLNNNDLTSIDIGAFNGLIKIESIKLNSNRLHILQPETFINLRALHSLYLESNNWDCNCRMQPFKRMLLIKQNIKIHDNPKCIANSVVWSNLALEHFQCKPTIMRNYSDTDVTISEGSTLRLKCAIFIESFGDSMLDEGYLSHSTINWSWKNIPITNNSKGCDHNCRNIGNNAANMQQFRIYEHIREYNTRVKIKISNLELISIMTVNEGNYICNVTNNAGYDEHAYRVRVIPYYSSNGGSYVDSHKITPAASSSSDSQLISYGTKINMNENGDHILFGLVLGILCGIFIVLVIFSIILVVFFRKHKVAQSQPHQFAMVDAASTDNNTVDENIETNTEVTDKLNVSQAEFNPLLVVNPVQKPPRLGIPDVSSIYSNPSWTMDRANYNRSRYASYAETEPLYSDYYTLYRTNRQMSRLDNRTFISDTASEV